MYEGLTRILGYVNAQARAARSRFGDDLLEGIDHGLGQLLAALRRMNAYVRDAAEWYRERRSQRELGELLAEHIGRFRQRSGVVVDLTIAPTWKEEAFSPSTRIQLLRLVQEALTNVRKHAATNHIHISLAVKSGHAQIQIEDDGRGFFLSRHIYRLLHPTFPRHGLCAMRDRARAVGGTFKIESSPGRGTHITVRVPLNRWAQAARR